MKFNPLELLTDFTYFFPMMWNVLLGKFKMPWSTLFWIILCLVYVISPIDLLPDVLPLLGIADDGAFILFVLSLVHNDIQRFRGQPASPEEIIEAEVIHTKDEAKK